MRILFALPFLIAVCVQAGSAVAAPLATGTDSDVFVRALASPARSAADRERDAREHPREVLTLAGFGPGATVADIFGGGGYYSEILSGVVGPRGHVVLVNNPPYDAYAKKELASRLADGRLANVAYRMVPAATMGLGRATLDGAMIVMSYHDLYVDDPENGWPAVDAAAFIAQIVRALKPGARLLIVDHAARDGSGIADAKRLHRIDETHARTDFAGHGLVFAGSLDVLRNPADDRSRHVFDPAIRHRTDRFVHVYRKP